MKQKLNDGWEWDVTGKRRHIHGYKSGTVAYVKRKMRRRMRQEAKAEVRDINLLEFDLDMPDEIVFSWEQRYGDDEHSGGQPIGGMK